MKLNQGDVDRILLEMKARKNIRSIQLETYHLNLELEDIEGIMNSMLCM